MKYLSAFLMAIMIYATPSYANACSVSKTLASDRIGPAVLSSDIHNLKKPFKYTVVQMASDGDDYLKYEIELCPGVIVVAETAVNNNAIHTIWTTSDYFATTKGARIGMTVSELKKLYPQGKTFIGPEEGLYAYFLTNEGISFGLHIESIPRDCFETNRNCERVVSGVKTIDAWIRK